MRWPSYIYDAATILVFVALLGFTMVVLASVLAGRALPFGGGFASSDERVPFERLVIRAPDQGVTVGKTPTATPTATATASPAASPEPSPTPTPAAPSAAVDVDEGSDGGTEAGGGATTLASPQAVETSTKTKGRTTVTWESSFPDLDYTLGDTLTLTVNWRVGSGAASYDSFALKGYTSSSDKDPAVGTAPTVTYPGSDGASSVDISFAFTGLHLDVKRNVETGNAHFKLYLRVDADADGLPETLAGYGVNVHVVMPVSVQW